MAQWFKNLAGDKDQPIEDYFEAHARAGNGQFAIAYALLGVARAIAVRPGSPAPGGGSDAPSLEPR